MPPSFRVSAPPPASIARGGPPLAVIAAVAANDVIGAGNALPWRLPADMRRFRALTSGHAVIMGRKTWESIGRVLPDRQNIVVTRGPRLGVPGVETASSLEDALERARMPAPAFCIGGAALYREALPRATTLYLTLLAQAFEGDATFPAFERSAWRECAREARADNGLDYVFVTLERIDV